MLKEVTACVTVCLLCSSNLSFFLHLQFAITFLCIIMFSYFPLCYGYKYIHYNKTMRQLGNTRIN